ncbi:MAG: hypothetical protein CL916_11645 [Deltaproteobacteria bacterium]|nr:hypothetical protein [Deltaproteobacteria bacterium]
MRFLLLIPVCISIACESSWEVVEKDGSDVFAGSCWPGSGDPIPPPGSLDYGLKAADIGVDKEDLPYDGIDANCDGKDDFDQDGDGFVPPQFEGVVTLGITSSGALPATDCWDSPDVITVQDGVRDYTISGLDIFPGAEEQYYDGIDQDCGGNNDFDQDGDDFIPEIFVGIETQIEGEISVDGAIILAVEDERSGGDCWDSLEEIESPTGAEESTLLGADIFPNATDTWYDGIDQDCAGNDDFDQDGDGYVSELYTEIGTFIAGSSLEQLEQAVTIDGTGEVQSSYDCNDIESDISPAGVEITADGIDQDCDLLDDCFEDLDLDGYGTDIVLLGTVATSADPDTPTPDSCDNGFLSGGMTGLSPYSTDCDDTQDTTYPGAAQIEDPDALFCMSDVDGDGYGDDAPLAGVDAGADCNDLDILFNPIASDPAADGLDQNCDDVDSCYYDTDGDGIGQNISYFDVTGMQATTTDCSGPNESPFNEDCNDVPNDDGAEVHPQVTLSEVQVANGVLLDSSCNSSTPYALQPLNCIQIDAALELCDGRDNDCSLDIFNPLVFDGVPNNEKDDDGDGHVECEIDSNGWDGDITINFTQMLGEDCDDADETIYPLALELCDGQDNNCDITIPANEIDDDSDGFVECIIDGDGWDGVTSPNFSVMLGEDCDDGDDTEYPGVIWYADSDGDTFGNADSSRACERTNNNDVLNTQDCDDDDETIFPGAPKLCDGQVNDVDADAGTCNTSLNVSDLDEVDNDSDGFVECTIDGGGWDGKITNTFTQMLGLDCDDGDNTEYPGVIWYADADNDTYGDPASFNDCERISTTDVLDNQDCDDGDDTEYPGVIWYADSDGDTFGNAASSNECERTNNNDVLNTRDCKDNDGTVYPGASKLCDGQVNDVDADAGTCGTALSVSDSDEVDDDGDDFVECVIDGGGWDGSNNAIRGGDCSDAITVNYGKLQPDGFYIHPGAAQTDSASACMKDVDEDGYGDQSVLQILGLQTGTDCDDTDSTEYPGVIWYADVDEDGYGNLASLNACERANNDDVLNTRDCNDNDDTVYPGASKLCDGQVNDVDADAGTCGVSLSVSDSDEVDDDGDGYVECILDGGGWNGIPSKFGRDCDDGDDTEYPGVIWYADVDEDGYGDLADSQSCQRANLDDVLNKKDCNDNDDTVYPGAPKLCDGQVNDVDVDAGTCSTALSLSDSDEVDDDGDGYVECAIDGDGWDGADSSIQGDDCSDAVTTTYGKPKKDGYYIHPGAAENDTNSSKCMKDVDEDGYGDSDIGILAQSIHLGTDCDDTDSTEYPGIIWYADTDGDGYGLASSSSSCSRASISDVTNARDCKDDDETVYPGASKLCDGQVNDVDVDAGTCSTALSVSDSDEIDNDGDGFVECTIDGGGWDGSNTSMEGGDCGDSDITVNPNATEVCDGQDNDCAGGVPSNETDDDGDGYVECSVDAGGWDAAAVTGYEDCNDADSSVFENQTYSVDGDGDGFGHATNTVSECLSSPSIGNVTNNTDCDDSSDSTFPGAAQLESGSDCMKDSDDDGYGDFSITGTVVAGTDCADSDLDRNPGELEVVADGIDQDCDGKESCYVDGDGDGVGGSSTSLSSTLDCSASGFDTANTDCDDSDGTISAFQTYYADNDGDTFGNPDDTVSECSLTPSAGNVTDNTDCDDSSDKTYPGAAINDSATDCMEDADGDDYGSTVAPLGGVAGTDCDDTESATYPYADESAGDNIDSNCDGLGIAVDNLGTLIDETIDCNGTWHIDLSGTESVYLLACNAVPSGYSAADAICTGTGKYDGVASLLDDNNYAEHEDLVDLFKDPSGAFGLGLAITPNTDYNHWISYTGFNTNGDEGEWADETSEAPNWEVGKPSNDGNTCTAGFYNASLAQTQVYNQSCSSTFELLTCSHRP